MLGECGRQPPLGTFRARGEFLQLLLGSTIDYFLVCEFYHLLIESPKACSTVACFERISVLSSFFPRLACLLCGVLGLDLGGDYFSRFSSFTRSFEGAEVSTGITVFSHQFLCGSFWRLWEGLNVGYGFLQGFSFLLFLDFALYGFAYFLAPADLVLQFIHLVFDFWRDANGKKAHVIYLRTNLVYEL